MMCLVVLKKTDCCAELFENCLLGAGVLGDSLGALRDGVLGELTREEEPDSGLDLAGGDGGPLVVVSQTAGLSSDSLKEIVDERVHDAHGLGGDTSVGVDLLQDLVDVDGVGLLPLVPLLLLVALGDGLGGLAGLLGSFSRNLGRHDDRLVTSVVLSEVHCIGRVFIHSRDYRRGTPHSGLTLSLIGHRTGERGLHCYKHRDPPDPLSQESGYKPEWPTPGSV